MSLLTPITPAEWNRAKARHLLNRAGFGLPHDAVSKMAVLTPEKAVDAFVNIENFPDNIKTPDWLPKTVDYREMRESMKDLSEDERRKQQNMMQRDERQAIEDLKEWWLRQMIETPRPLQEKMTLFWHGHFATSAFKVKSAEYNYDINSRFRRLALGNFRWLTIAAAKSPAMLRYLDNQQNIKGKPNENFARELLELFTMGIGHYTEQDVKEAARAFTGWTQRNGEFVMNARQHDTGQKTFLGRRGAWGGEDIINIIFEQPATAEFISRKLLEFFVYEQPGDEVVKECAAALRGANYELVPLLRTIFLSREFYSERAMGTQIKSPAQYMTGLIDSLAIDPKSWRVVTLAMRQMGQDLFAPPNVKGWPGNRDWINTNTLLVRMNIPAYAVWGADLNARRPLELDELRDGRDAMTMADNSAMSDVDSKAQAQRQQRLQRVRQQLARQASQAPFDAAAFFGELKKPTIGQTVDTVVDYFLVRPIESSQRDALINVLSPEAKPDAPFDPAKATDTQMRALVHLVLSMSEYQLC